MAATTTPSFLCSLALLAGCAVPAPAEPVRMNPFHDPFVAVTQGVPCPPPLGPAYTEGEFRQQEHVRVERGTSCWLAGKCSEPNAYRYDARIAPRVVAALRAEPALAGTSIWVTVQGRYVYLEGCVANREQAARAEALAAGTDEVVAAIPFLVLPGESPRYRAVPER